MCGICGFIDPQSGYNREQIVENMMNKMAHRGPDDGGKHIGDPAFLGFRRLSIIDLSAGHQPIYNEDNTKAIIFNGEIYNYQEIRAVLVEKGHQFRTHSDTEVLLHGYEEYGTDLFKYIRGMFGFVIWDETTQTLFGARDFFGIKPMYYAPIGDGMVFASEIKCILEHPRVERRLNHQALYSYLTFQYSPLQESMFSGIFKLPPGHYFTFKDGKMDVQQYWSADFRHAEKERTMDDYCEELEAVLQDSVKAHMVSDVEVGSFLSSGVDSSYVAASFKGQNSFTVGFDHEGYSEVDEALRLAKQIGLKSHSKIISPEEYWEAIPKIQYHMDEPLGDPSSIALYFVSKLASEHVKVTLSGEGADELFGGYRIYQEPLSLQPMTNMPAFARNMVGTIARKSPVPFYGRNYLIRGSKDLTERFIGNANIFNEHDVRRLLKNPAENALSPMDITGPYYEKSKGFDAPTRMQHLDINLWMVGDILLKADRMSMANSIELRVPFLDRKVWDVAAGIPTEFKVNRHTTKVAFRNVAAKKLPPEYSSRRKLGFPVPIRVWLKDPQYSGRVREQFESATAREFFNTQELLQLLDDHFHGRVDNSRKIWLLYVFLVWFEQYFK